MPRARPCSHPTRTRTAWRGNSRSRATPWSFAVELVLFPPRQRDELISVARERLGNRLGAVEQSEVTVRQLHLRGALADDGTEDGAGAIDMDVPLDVDETLEAEVAVDRQVPIDVQETLSVAALV